MRIKLEVFLTVNEIIKFTDGKVGSEVSAERIEWIATDSREVRSGDLFIALKGDRFDGAEHIGEAVLSGGIVLSTVECKHGIKVGDTKKALSEIARLYKSKLKKLKYTVAVTGSVGKSTAKEFVSVIFAEHFRVASTIGNYNNIIGVCLSVLSAARDTEVLVLELGMNHRGEIAELSRIIEPDLSIITNIGTSHIGNLGSREEIALAKLEITEGMKEVRLVLPYGESLLPYERAISFSVNDSRADYFLEYNYGSVDLYYAKRRILTGEFRINERHLTECLAPALAAACELGVPISRIKSGMEKIKRDSIRQKYIHFPGFTIYSDCYNASVESISAALAHIGAQKQYPSKSAVLGCVMELGEMSIPIHREIGRIAAGGGLNRLYLFGEFAEEIKLGAIHSGFDESKIFLSPEADPHSAIAVEILKEHSPGELILLKGSRATRPELVILHLEEITNKKEG